MNSHSSHRLKATVPGFDMLAFMEMLDARKEELMGEVFDLLLSLGDFETFKEVMLSYKRESQQVGQDVQVSSVARQDVEVWRGKMYKCGKTRCTSVASIVCSWGHMLFWDYGRGQEIWSWNKKKERGH